MIAAVLAALAGAAPAVLAAVATSEGKRGWLPLGAPAPDFSLPDVASGRTVSLKDFAGRDALLVMFLCKHCPYVQHVQAGVAAVAKEYAPRNVGIVAISANDVSSYPEDAPAGLKAQAKSAGFSFPYLYDESQAVAQAYTAICTPDFFVFDRNRTLAYRGRFDESRPGSGKSATGKDLREALEAVLAGRPTSGTQRPSIGCSIKWREGNEPAYAK